MSWLPYPENHHAGEHPHGFNPVLFRLRKEEAELASLPSYIVGHAGDSRLLYMIHGE